MVLTISIFYLIYGADISNGIQRNGINNIW